MTEDELDIAFRSATSLLGDVQFAEIEEGLDNAEQQP